MIFAGLNPTCYKQDHQDENHDTKAAAPVVTGAVKWTAANSAKAAQQGDHQDDEKDGPK